MGKIYKPLMVFVFILCSWIQVQGQTVSGIVQDDQGQPLPGATVQIEAIQKVTTSDVNGNFQFTNIPAGDYNLKITFIGFKPIIQAIKVEQGKNVVIPKLKMKMDAQQLDDVVVVGYGTQQKREVTGSISKLTSKEITALPVQSIETTLQGVTPGVQVIQSSGVAGAGAIVRIRGISSLSAGGDPLYVVDGIPITQDPFLNGERGGQNTNPLATMNPNDIESIEVLKDAAATGIYGSRGANGVILITTKRGKGDKPIFEFSTRIGTSSPTKLPDMLNGEEWIQLKQEAWENDGNVGRVDLPVYGKNHELARRNNTDWIKETVGLGMKQEYNLSVKQKVKKLSYYGGFSYSDNGSYLIGNSYNRLTGRINVDYQLLKNLRIGVSSSLARGLNNRADVAWAGGLGQALSFALPIFPVFDENGAYFRPNNGGSFSNPVAKRNLVDWKTVENRSINNININYSPIKNLTLIGTASIDLLNMNDNIFEKQGWDLVNPLIDRSKLWVTHVNNWNANFTATYNMKIKEKHKLTLLIGSEAQKSITRKNYTEKDSLGKAIAPNPKFLKYTEEYKDLVENNSDRHTREFAEKWSFLSWFARANYSFNDKIYATVNYRVDASSRFGENNRFAYFPSAGLGYVISEENFLKNNKAISYLRLKTSFGYSGNADIPNYRRLGLYRASQTLDNTNYNGQPIIYPAQLANPDISWEKVRTFDYGFELGFLDNRFSIDFTIFNKLSTDVLANNAIQTSTGVNDLQGSSAYYKNVGKILNKGFETNITSRNLVGKFRWTTTFNVIHLNQEVLDVGVITPDALSGSGDTRVLVGYPVGVNYLTRVSRIDSESGLPVFLDANGNETYNWDEANRVPVGSVIPDFTGGITNSFEYKGFDFSFMFVFTKGGNIYDDAIKRQLGVFTDWNFRTEIIDGRWTKPGDDAKYPRLTGTPGTYGGMGSEWQYNTDQWLFDASYLRLRSVSLGYTLPTEFLAKARIKSARVYFVATNLLTFTKFPGLDPEIARDFNGPQARNISPNVSYLTPPQEKSFAIGINLSF